MGALTVAGERLLSAIWSGARQFWRQQSGGIAVTAALAAPLLLGIGGLASDYTNLMLIRTELQAAADGAALAAARKMTLAGIDESDVRQSVETSLRHAVDTRNGPYSHEANVTMQDGTVAVTLTQTWAPFFMQLINATVTPVSVEAKAQLVGTANVCVLALHPTATATVHLTMLARVEAHNCGVFSNSTSFSGIRLDLMGKIEASIICSAGGTFGLLSHFSPKPTTDCPPVEDPLAGLAEPEVRLCDHHDLRITAGSHILSPGVYCGGIAVRNGAEVTFMPGTYIIKDGPLSVRNKAVAAGENVGFFLTGDDALIDFRGTSTIELSGQEDGPMAGLLFFEDRAAPLDRTHLINSSNARRLTGTIYLPRGRLLVDPNAPVAPDSDYTAIVARQIALTEGPTLVLNSNYDLSRVPVPAGIRATQRVLLTE